MNPNDFMSYCLGALLVLVGIASVIAATHIH